MQRTLKYVKIATATLVVAVLGAVQTVQAYELINTATNEIVQVEDLGKYDLLKRYMQTWTQEHKKHRVHLYS